MDSKDFLQSEVSLLLFSAEWSAPARALRGPLSQEAAERELLFCEIDVDANPELARQWGVRAMPSRYSDHGLPTVVLLREGDEQGRFVGHPKNIHARLERLLARQVVLLF